MAEWSKALVLGTSYFDSAGSNPAPVIFWHVTGGLAQSVECVVRNDEAPGSKPGFSKFQCFHSLVVRTPLCGSGNPGSTPGGGTYLLARLV